MSDAHSDGKRYQTIADGSGVDTSQFPANRAKPWKTALLALILRGFPDIGKANCLLRQQRNGSPVLHGRKCQSLLQQTRTWRSFSTLKIIRLLYRRSKPSAASKR